MTDGHLEDETTSRVRPLDSRPLLVVLGAVSAALLVINVVLKVLADPGSDLGPWLMAFDVNHENNVPTAWNAALLLAVAAAAVLVAHLRASLAAWPLVAVVATAMALDELLRLHERLRTVGVLLREELGISLPTYAAVLPLALLALALLVGVVTAARRLPADVQRAVLLGVLLYLGGAVVMEGVSGWIEGTFGSARVYTVATTAEEGLEMGGCLVVLAGILRMVRSIPLGTSRALAGRPVHEIS